MSLISTKSTHYAPQHYFIRTVPVFDISFLHPKITLRVPQVLRVWRHWYSGKHLSPLTKGTFYFTLVPRAMQDHPTTRMYFICWPLELSHADGRRSSGVECNERQFVYSFLCIFATNVAISCGGIRINWVRSCTSPRCSCDEITVESPLPAS